MITVEGSFIDGIGQGEGIEAARKFTLRSGMVLDSIEALEELGPDASGIRLQYATVARRLAVEGIDQVTSAMVFHLSERDGEVLQDKLAELEKKLSESKSD